MPVAKDCLDGLKLAWISARRRFVGETQMGPVIAVLTSTATTTAVSARFAVMAGNGMTF